MEMDLLQSVVRAGAVIFYGVAALILFSMKNERHGSHWFWFGMALAVESAGLALRLLPAGTMPLLPLARVTLHFSAGAMVLYGVSEMVREGQPPDEAEPVEECALRQGDGPSSGGESSMQSVAARPFA